MKKVLKFIASFVVGGAVGFLLAMAGLSLFMDLGWDEIGGRFLSADWVKIGGTVLLSLVAAVVAFSLQVILHEGGHLVGGLLSGYRFLSFRLFRWTFIREEGHLRIKRFEVSGTGGQCLMVPPAKPAEEIPYLLYHAGGFGMNLLVALLSALLLFLVETPMVLTLLLIMLAITGLFLFLMNGIPMKVGGMGNDAYNIRALRGDVRVHQCLIDQMRVNAGVQQGETASEMPDAWFRTFPDEAELPVFLACSEIMYYSRLMERRQWEDAQRGFLSVLERGKELPSVIINEVRGELLFLSLLIGDTEKATTYYTAPLKEHFRLYSRFLSSKKRLLFAIAWSWEKNRRKAEEIYQEVCEHRSDYLMQGEVKADIRLMDDLKEAVPMPE